MKTLIKEERSTIERLAERLKQARGRREYQRIQCVLLRATLGSSAAEIARVLGWATTTVHNIHSRWAREGEAIFDLKPRGGRRHQYLTPQEEAQLLAPFTQQARDSGMLQVAQVAQVAQVRRAYEQRVGKAVAASTVYRLLDRHGWRKVCPAPELPEGGGRGPKICA